MDQQLPGCYYQQKPTASSGSHHATAVGAWFVSSGVMVVGSALPSGGNEDVTTVVVAIDVAMPITTLIPTTVVPVTTMSPTTVAQTVTSLIPRETTLQLHGPSTSAISQQVPMV